MTPKAKATKRSPRRSPGRLLLAVDFSTPSKDALEAAAALAEDLGAGIVLLHVTPLKEDVRPKGGSKISRKTAGHVASDAARLTTEWAEDLRKLGPSVDSIDEVGDPPSIILAKADELRCSIIVLASSGKGRLRSLLAGSTTREVVRRSRLPVLVVPGRRPRRRRPEPSSKTLVVAADFSTGSQAAFDAALSLAKDLKAQVRVVHVIHLPMPIASFPYSDAAISADLLDRQEDDAAVMLAKLAAKGRAKKVGVVPNVHIGDPASIILAEARQVGAPLIVVGSHGQSTTHQFFLGSVAQAVVQMADRPVLVVPDPKGPEAG